MAVQWQSNGSSYAVAAKYFFLENVNVPLARRNGAVSASFTDGTVSASSRRVAASTPGNHWQGGDYAMASMVNNRNAFRA